MQRPPSRLKSKRTYQDAHAPSRGLHVPAQVCYLLSKCTRFCIATYAKSQPSKSLGAGAGEKAEQAAGPGSGSSSQGEAAVTAVTAGPAGCDGDDARIAESAEKEPGILHGSVGEVVAFLQQLLKQVPVMPVKHMPQLPLQPQLQQQQQLLLQQRQGQGPAAPVRPGQAGPAPGAGSGGLQPRPVIPGLGPRPEEEQGGPKRVKLNTKAD